MKDHPILFTGEMVRAIMTCAQCGTVTLEIECPKCGSRERRKTQTRRVEKPQPKVIKHIDEGSHVEWSCRKWPNLQVDNLGDLASYGRYSVGDLLWVRETWACGIEWDSEKPKDIDPLCGGSDIWYLADGERPEGYGKIRSPRFMPKWGCRLWLKVKAVRVERVQEISEIDCIREGIILKTSCGTGLPDHGSAYSQFRDLWDSINAKRGYGWDTNPVIRVIEFERYDK